MAYKNQQPSPQKDQFAYSQSLASSMNRNNQFFRGLNSSIQQSKVYEIPASTNNQQKNEEQSSLFANQININNLMQPTSNQIQLQQQLQPQTQPSLYSPQYKSLLNVQAPTNKHFEGVSNQQFKPANQQNDLNKKPPNYFYQMPSQVYEHYNEEDYSDYQIPPNWEIAKLHGLSRQVGPIISDSSLSQRCPCCGWQVERQKLSACCDNKDLYFLGSAFPCYYNWVKFAALIALIVFLVSGIYNIIQDKNGTSCVSSLDLSLLKGYTNQQIDTIMQKDCTYSLYNQFSLFNRKVNGSKDLRVDQYLALGAASAIAIILFLIRFFQNSVDRECDSALITPSDYTIQVWNIPKNLETNYEQVLKYIFTNCAVVGQMMNVTNVVLVYDNSYLLDIEKKFNAAIQAKQAFLKSNGFKETDPQYKDLSQEIETLEKRHRLIKKEIREDPKLFSGTAFVSFSSEQEKQKVLESNKSSFFEEIQAYFNDGKMKDITPKDLTWDQHKLFLREAPEPHDIDWSNIYLQNFQGFILNIACWFVTAILGGIMFLAVWGILALQNYFIKQVLQEAQEGASTTKYSIGARVIAITFGFIIVLFNKLLFSKIIYSVVKISKSHTRSSFYSHFATKLTWITFFNSSIAIYLYYHFWHINYGRIYGFAETQSWVIIWNSVLPLIIELFDIPSECRDSYKTKMLKSSYESQSYITQKQANELMENIPYNIGQSYSEPMQLLWLTLFYAQTLPFATICSALSLILYLFIDKYNLLNRRSVNESISKVLTNSMIELSETSILIFSGGALLFTHEIFSVWNFPYLLIFCLSFIYMCLPMQELVDLFCNPKSKNTEIPYEVAQQQFITDYYKQNPLLSEKLQKNMYASKIPQQQQMQQLNLTRKIEI